MARIAHPTAVRRALGGLLAVGALNAFGGGVYGMSGADELPTEWLQGTPFHTYVLPGLILFAVVGGSLLLAAAAVFQRSAPGRAAAIAAGVVLLGWIAVETALIGYVSWLQPVTAVAGLAVVCLALLLEDADRTATRERVRGDRMAAVRLDRDALSDHWLSVFDSADSP